jgi:hypothetical protein
VHQQLSNCIQVKQIGQAMVLHSTLPLAYLTEIFDIEGFLFELLIYTYRLFNILGTFADGKCLSQKYSSH